MGEEEEEARIRLRPFEQEPQQCPHCGPTCLGGAAHNARKEDGVMYPDLLAAAPAQPAPADVVERMVNVFDCSKDQDYSGSIGDKRSCMTAALAVAREGYLPASELQDLRRWKKEQMQVESEWDAQAVGRELDLPLGSSIRAGILPAIKELQQQLATMHTKEQVEQALAPVTDDEFTAENDLPEHHSDRGMEIYNSILRKRLARLTAPKQEARYVASDAERCFWEAVTLYCSVDQIWKISGHVVRQRKLLKAD